MSFDFLYVTSKLWLIKGLASYSVTRPLWTIWVTYLQQCLTSYTDVYYTEIPGSSNFPTWNLTSNKQLKEF